MAVAFSPAFDDRSGSVSVSDEGRITKNYTKTWKAESTAGEDEAQVIQAFVAWAGINIFTAHPNDALARLRKIDASQAAGAKFWTVTVEFSTRTPPEEDSENENPFDDPVKRNVTTAQGTRILDKDTDGEPILNAAGDAFDPPIEIPESGLVFRFVRNEPEFLGPTALQYIDHINSAPWGGAPEGTIRCNAIEQEEDSRNGIRYIAVTYEFEYVKRGWQPEPLQQGLRQVSMTDTLPAEPIRIPILDGNGEPVSTPVPLDENGLAIDPEDLPGAAIFRDTKGYSTVDFNALGLPTGA